MLTLYLQAPFAACRTFTAGWNRPSATFLTPTSVYGLLMNVAGIETRLPEQDAAHDGSVAASLMRTGLPEVSLAIGAAARSPSANATMSLEDSLPQVQSIFQQLHNYPVGKDAGMPAELAKGNKNNITPIRREFLSDVRVSIRLRADQEIEKQIAQNLSQVPAATCRYGLPFLGDNQFLIDRLEVTAEPTLGYWFIPLSESEQAELGPHTVRLTTWIDRADMSKTTSVLYAPAKVASLEPPEAAWTTVGPRS